MNARENQSPESIVRDIRDYYSQYDDQNSIEM